MENTAFNKIIHDIRNMRELTKQQQKDISSLTQEQKDEIIFLYNEMIIYSNELINQLYYENNSHK